MLHVEGAPAANTDWIVTATAAETPALAGWASDIAEAQDDIFEAQTATAADRVAVAGDKIAVAGDRATVSGYVTQAGNSVAEATAQADRAEAEADRAEQVAVELDPTNLQAQINALDAEKAPLESPALTGTPTVPTAPPGTNTTQAASTGFVIAARDALLDGVAVAGNTLKKLYDLIAALTTSIAALAPAASPAFTGAPTAPTAAPGTNTTQLATTAFVQAALGGLLSASVEDQTVTGGARITSKALGTGGLVGSGTITPDPGDRPFQHYSNQGAHALAPGTNPGSYVLDITNIAGAGAIDTSAWTKVVGSFTATVGAKFRCACTVGNAGSLLIIQQLV
jgi:hypothetical protein